MKNDNKLQTWYSLMPSSRDSNDSSTDGWINSMRHVHNINSSWTAPHTDVHVGYSCMCVFLCVCMCVCVLLHTAPNTDAHSWYVCVCMCVCVCVCVFACIWKNSQNLDEQRQTRLYTVRMCVCVCVCVCVCKFEWLNITNSSWAAPNMASHGGNLIGSMSASAPWAPSGLCGI